MKRNLKLFLFSSIPFGLVMGLWYAQEYSFLAGLKGGVIAGAFFGFATSLILGFLHSRAVKKITTLNAPDELGVRHTRKVTLRLRYDAAFDLCISALSLFGRCTVVEEDRLQGRIMARTGVNWKTWGDTITFTIVKTGSEHAQVTVSSRPTARTTIVDYGKNLDNVKKLISFLSIGVYVLAIYSLLFFSTKTSVF